MKPIGKPFIELLTVESSNNYATGQLQAQLAEHGTTWFAHEQTKGKGQRGNSWTSEPGENIILTTVVEPKCLRIDQQFVLSAAIALGCHDFFSAYAFDETKIKWPNDLYWKDRKAGGILIENILKGSEWKYAIVGIGININQTTFPSSLPNPVSLKQITGKTFKLVELAKELTEALNQRWNQVEEGMFNQILNDYNSRFYKKNEEVEFKKGRKVLSATIRGVNEKGELLLCGETEVKTAIKFGEWEWMVEGC